MTRLDEIRRRIETAELGDRMLERGSVRWQVWIDSTLCCVLEDFPRARAEAELIVTAIDDRRYLLDHIDELKQELDSTPDLRDRFAMAALTGLLANVQAIREARSIVGSTAGKITEEGVLAHFAYQHADAMLDARTGSPEQRRKQELAQ